MQNLFGSPEWVASPGAYCAPKSITSVQGYVSAAAIAAA